MNYFRINFTLDHKVYGSRLDYVKSYHLLIPPGKPFYEVPKYIGNIRLKEIDFQPYVLDIELLAKSKLLDLIQSGGPISSKLILSGSLKYFLEKHRNSGMQFFQMGIIHKGIRYEDYWILNMYECNQEYINFKESLIIYDKKAIDFKVSYMSERTEVKISNMEEFDSLCNKARKNMEVVTIEKLKLKNNITVGFFALHSVRGGVGYFVSEKVKHEIEDAGCTGIEFQPAEMSYNEWTVRDGPRDRVYGRTW